MRDKKENAVPQNADRRAPEAPALQTEHREDGTPDAAETSAGQVPSVEMTGPAQADALTESQQKAAQYYDQMVRLKAEFENYCKRMEKERPELIKWGRTELLLRMLPLYDVLLHAHAHVNKVMIEDKAACNGVTGDLCRGLELIFKEFSKLFESEGVREMETVGRPYDPMAHEIVGIVEAGDDAADGTVAEELQKGFMTGDRVVRPARVKIARKKSE
ncbi:MAG: nucleotide exchange factor GrpE [bacterium]